MSSTLSLALFIFLIVLTFTLSFPHGGYHHHGRRYGHGGRRHGHPPHYRGKRQLSFPSLFSNLFGNQGGGGHDNWGWGGGQQMPSLWNQQPFNNGFGDNRNNFFGNRNNDYYGQNPHNNDYYGQNHRNNDYYGQNQGQGKWNQQNSNGYPQQGQQQPQNQGQKLVPPQPIVIVLDSSKFGKPVVNGQTPGAAGTGQVQPNQPEGNPPPPAAISQPQPPPPSQVNTGLENVNVPTAVQPSPTTTALENGKKPVENQPSATGPEQANPFATEGNQDPQQPIESKDTPPSKDDWKPAHEYEYEDGKSAGQELGEYDGGEGKDTNTLNPVAEKSTPIEQAPAPTPTVDQSGSAGPNQPKPWEESDFDDYKKTLDSLQKDKHKETVVVAPVTTEEKHETPNTQIHPPIAPTTPVVPSVTVDKDHPSESEGGKEIDQYDYDDYKDDVSLKLEDIGNKNNSTSENHPKRNMQIDARQNIN